jgi:hypothetical protein
MLVKMTESTKAADKAKLEHEDSIEEVVEELDVLSNNHSDHSLESL